MSLQKPIYFYCVTVAHILSLQDKHEITILLPSEIIKRWEVKRTNTDLPNTYHRSTTDTIMHTFGHNILKIIYPHFGIDFLQPPRFLNSEDSETIKLDHFLFFQTVNVPPQQENVFHHY